MRLSCFIQRASSRLMKLLVLTCFVSWSFLVSARIVVMGQNILKRDFAYSDNHYLISEPLDLSGGVMILPQNSILEFKDDGVLLNGTVVGNNTELVGKPRFQKTRINGSFRNQVFYSSWCSDSCASDFVEDVMNVSHESRLFVDTNVTLSDSKRRVDHLYIEGDGHTIMNSDRFFILRGGCELSDLVFRWNKRLKKDPIDNYNAVVVYSNLLQKDTTIIVRIRNVDADGGRYSSYFMKQYKSSISPSLQSNNYVENSRFVNFTRGAIWTCGGFGHVINCTFNDIGYESSSSIQSVFPLRLGYSATTLCGKAIGYVVKGCDFMNIVAPYNQKNNGRELHGILAYGDSLHIQGNRFQVLSTTFSSVSDPGMDAEMLYIKGSYCIIEDNYFEDGAGSHSDGVITLKEGNTEYNTINNNVIINKRINSRQINIGGRNHIIEKNLFSTSVDDKGAVITHSIYLAHHEVDLGKESIRIADNVFEFSPKSSVMAIYANGWGRLIIENNAFKNPRILLKNNGRVDETRITNNSIELMHVLSDKSDYFISSTSINDSPLNLLNNSFYFCGVTLGRFISGNQYVLQGNIVRINNSRFDSLLRGSKSSIKVLNNVFYISDDTIVSRNAVIGEKRTESMLIEGNRFNSERVLKPYL